MALRAKGFTQRVWRRRLEAAYSAGATAWIVWQRSGMSELFRRPLAPLQREVRGPNED